MCENFKQSVLESINKRIKDDIYELDILKTNYNINVHPCRNANNELYTNCKKRYIFDNIPNNGILKGKQCPTCKTSFCETCVSLSMVACAQLGFTVCHKCWAGPKGDKGTVKCLICKNNTRSNSIIKTHGVCLECNVLVPL